MRQTLNKKKVNKYAKELNLPIEKILVRGGTDHRKDLCLKDGTILCLFSDGTLCESKLKWK